METTNTTADKLFTLALLEVASSYDLEAYEGDKDPKNLKADWADTLEVDLRTMIYPSLTKQNSPGYQKSYDLAEEFMTWTKLNLEQHLNEQVAAAFGG